MAKNEKEEDDDEERDRDEDGWEDGWKPKNAGPRKPIRGAIRCHDGFVMSVQASRDHYCTPRDDAGPHSAVEVGWPNRLEELLLPHADRQRRPQTRDRRCT